jgi:hypothetical protein
MTMTQIQEPGTTVLVTNDVTFLPSTSEKASRVISGNCQYPEQMLGPVTATVPTSPAGHGCPNHCYVHGQVSMADHRPLVPSGDAGGLNQGRRRAVWYVYRCKVPTQPGEHMNQTAGAILVQCEKVRDVGGSRNRFDPRDVPIRADNHARAGVGNEARMPIRRGKRPDKASVPQVTFPR